MKQLTVLLILLFSVVSFSQNNFQGKATYMSKRSMDMSRFDKMPEQQKKQMLARFKNVLEKTYTLSFNKTTSSFKEDVKLEGPGVSGPSWSRSNGQSSIYKNIPDKNIIEDIEMFGKRFLVSEKMEPLQWEMGMETKKIGNYTCYKATLVKEDTNVDWGSIFRRRDNKKKETITSDKLAKKMLTVTAWYAPQIPISSGPDVYWGLPGLILEINAGRTTMLCTEVAINSDKVLEIKQPTKGKKITRAAYTKIVKEKTAELKERFKKRGRGNRKRF